MTTAKQTHVRKSRTSIRKTNSAGGTTMKKVTYNDALAKALRAIGVKSPSTIWFEVKAIIPPRNAVSSTKDITAAVKQHKDEILALVAAAPAPKAKKPAPEGTLRRAIQDYEPKAKTTVFVKADGTEVQCTEAQKVAWEQARDRFAAKAKATQAVEPSARAKMVRETIASMTPEELAEFFGKALNLTLKG